MNLRAIISGPNFVYYIILILASTYFLPNFLHHQRKGQIQFLFSNQELFDKIFNFKKNASVEKLKFLPVGSLIGGHEIVNTHPFNYVLNSPYLCPIDETLLFVAYVHTAPEHHKRRMVIRQTWGNSKYYKEPMRLFFVMGLSLTMEKAAEQALLFEAEQYSDIIQEDFIDSYHNLTYKAIAGLKWIDNNCRNARYVLKTDDDIFVNSFNLIRSLEHLKPPKYMLRCIVWYNMKVERTGKWKVSYEEYKQDYYPKYCSGSAFLMTMDSVQKLYNASFYVRFFWVDDLYATGFLPLYSGGFTFVSAGETYLLNGNKLFDEFLSEKGLKKYVFSHVHDLKIFLKVWNLLAKKEGFS